jgi:hypothetical protein
MKNFQSFFDGHSQQTEYPIYTMTETERVIFGSYSPVLWLSRISVDEHKIKHPEVVASDYFKIREMIKVGQIYRQGNKRFALLHVDGVLYRTAIKVTADNEKMYLLTVFRTTKEKATKEVVDKFVRIR